MDRFFRVDACDFIKEVPNERVDLRNIRQRYSGSVEARTTTNLSIVRMCQKVRGTLDDVNLPVGVS